MDQPQTFRSPTAVVIWVVWLLFAAANWIDLAVEGRDHASAVAAAVLLLATGVAYVTAQRPRIIAGDAGLTVRNPLRDHRVGWAGVVKVDLVDLLRVHTREGKVITAWAVHYSRRRQFAAEARARRAASPRRSSFGLPYVDGRRGQPYAASPAEPAAKAEAELIVRLLTDHAAAAQAQATPQLQTPATAQVTTQAQAQAGADGPNEPLTSTWSGRAIAALVVPMLILLLVWLL